MAKAFIKMNNNENQLSLGNFFRLIKELSQNKTSALQSELFCILFDVEKVNDTTVNNYCVGCRSIGDEFKQIYLNKQKKYNNDSTIFYNTIIDLLRIIDGKIYVIKNNQKEFINSNKSLQVLCEKVYNIAKNDKSVTTEFVILLKDYLTQEKYYEFIVEILFFIILNKKQPLYDIDLKKEAIEKILRDTYMSSFGLEEYLSLKLRESINYDFSLRKLADSNNAYACFEIGTNEYCGYVTGFPRYEEAYKYLKKAASYNHAGACYLIGNMLYRGLIGHKSQDDMNVSYNYLQKAIELGNIAALNVLGLMYQEGQYPVAKNEQKALELFKKASASSYAYSLNNLGKYYEMKKDYSKAFSYYLESANLGESWACNKVGECYRQGKYTAKNENLAFQYYENAIQSNYRTLCFYAYYNLANYYYYGNIFINIEKNEVKALEYYQIAANHNIFEAQIKLFEINVNEYQKARNPQKYQEIIKYKNLIEHHPKYSQKIAQEINFQLSQLSKIDNINLNYLNQ